MEPPVTLSSQEGFQTHPCLHHSSTTQPIVQPDSHPPWLLTNNPLITILLDNPWCTPTATLHSHTLHTTCPWPRHHQHQMDINTGFPPHRRLPRCDQLYPCQCARLQVGNHQLPVEPQLLPPPPMPLCQGKGTPSPNLPAGHPDTSSHLPSLDHCQ